MRLHGRNKIRDEEQGEKMTTKRICRYYRDGGETFQLTLSDTATYRSIIASYSSTIAELDSCNSYHGEGCYGLRIVGVKCFVERWKNRYHDSPRDRIGFRKAVSYEVCNNAFNKYAEAIREAKSDSDTVVEIFESIRTFVEGFEAGANAT